MAKYLVDANLPYYFALWNNDDFIHVRDLDDTWSDETIWQYARDNRLTIITKDADFSTKVLYKGAPPKVIHLKIGNMRIKDFHQFISMIWQEVSSMTENYNLINVYSDRIEAIK